MIDQAIAPLLYWPQLLLLDRGAGIYETSSIPVSVALVYLVTNVSTHNHLKTRAKVEATEADLRVGTEISTGKLTTASAGHEYPMINTSGRRDKSRPLPKNFEDDGFLI